VYPVLFSIGKFELHSYGVLLTLSFIIGIYLGMRRAADRGVQPQFISDLAMVIVLCGLLGARALYVVFHLDEFKGRWLDTINPIQSTGEIGIAGLTLLGGFLLAVAGSAVFCRMKKVQFYRVADILSPSLALGIALSRIGCYLNGCCFGTPSEIWCAVTYPAGRTASFMFGGQPVHPSQIYESLGALLMFGGLYVIERRKPPIGQVFGWFLVMYAILRFLGDMTRYYETVMQVDFGIFVLSVNQLICLGLAVAGIYIIKLRQRTENYQR
jgi:phosphatidylglycerol---prolipoprotein diacylglyceryl transferase